MNCEVYSVLPWYLILLLRVNKTFLSVCQMPTVHMQLLVEIALKTKQTQLQQGLCNLFL